MKSFSLLELSISPGAARKAHAFLSNNLNEITTALETDLKIELAAEIGLLYCYKENITLRTFLQGEEKQQINFLPYMTVHGQNGINFKLDEQANPISVSERVVCQEDLLMGASVQINWSSIPIQELTGDLLQRGEEVETMILYGSDYSNVDQYGFNDLEFSMTEEEYLQEITEFFSANT
ncbi:MAG TPA: hypothetical protein VK203_00230 [Nostocaceae cyanobacterium]|nr:hypothetical protein [Nostocaceae cyanobacterium]